jgi:hypothetical protein
MEMCVESKHFDVFKRVPTKDPVVSSLLSSVSSVLSLCSTAMSCLQVF